MKKILLTFIAAIGLTAAANAQLTTGTIFPYPGGATGELTAVNAPFTGHQFNLDSLSNAGYTIFIDVSATWCPPCWAYHQSGALDTLWQQHGPLGAPGVDATTTNDVFVIFIQGEPTSHLAELYGDYAAGAILYSTTESPQSQVTQGDWVTGTTFPIIDDTTSTDATYGTNALDADLDIAYFPTVYMICRDKIVYTLSQPTATDAYADVVASCPTTPPASGASVDAKATVYTGTDYFVCNATPAVSFQNYSSAASISSATITVTDATGASVATVPWTGTLAPFGLASVSVPSFAGTSFGGYKYSVSVTGDINPADNASPDSQFVVYAPVNAAAIPDSENFLEPVIPYKEIINSPDGEVGIGYWDPTEVGPDGTTATNSSFVIITPEINNGTVEEFIFGNFVTTGATNLYLTFDESFAQITATSTDKLEVNVSNDCGTTWVTAFSESGSTLATAPVDASSYYFPTTAAEWAAKAVSLSSETGAQTLVKFDFTADGGNNFFLDDIKIANLPTTSVAQVQAFDAINIAPNPATDMAYVNLNMVQPSNVTVQLMDAVGRIVYTANQDLPAGAGKIALSTDALATGIYMVKVTANGNATTKQLSVVK